MNPRRSAAERIFRKRLVQLRELRGLTQAELAKRAKLQPAAISHFETGQRTPCLENLVRLADALKCNVGTLVGRA